MELAVLSHRYQEALGEYKYTTSLPVASAVTSLPLVAMSLCLAVKEFAQGVFAAFKGNDRLKNSHFDRAIDQAMVFAGSILNIATLGGFNLLALIHSVWTAKEYADLQSRASTSN